MGDIKNIKIIPMTRELIHNMYKNFTNDPAIFAENFHEYVYDEMKVDSKFYQDIKDKTRKVFAICFEGNEIPLGELKLKNINLKKKECTMSIHLTNDAVKNKGYGTVAEKLALQYAFNKMGMKAVNADAILKNKRSQHVLKKVGFKYIGKDNDFKYYRCEVEK